MPTHILEKNMGSLGVRLDKKTASVANRILEMISLEFRIQFATRILEKEEALDFVNVGF